jgi:antitoxin component YwqK of YwqJK toxin-antitoxin module
MFIFLLALTGCSVLNEDGYPKEFENSKDVYYEGRRVKEFKDFDGNKITARYFGYEKDGKTIKHGLYEGYDENGTKRADVIFRDGIPDGVCIYYRGDKGTLKIKGIYRKGRPWEGQLFCFGMADAVFTFENGKDIMLENLKGGTIAKGEWKNDMRWEGSFYNPTNGMIEYYEKGKLSKSVSLEDILKRNDKQVVCPCPSP